MDTYRLSDREIAGEFGVCLNVLLGKRAGEAKQGSPFSVQVATGLRVRTRFTEGEGNNKKEPNEMGLDTLGVEFLSQKVMPFARRVADSLPPDAEVFVSDVEMVSPGTFRVDGFVSREEK